MDFREYQKELRSILQKMSQDELQGYIWHQLVDIESDNKRKAALFELKKGYTLPKKFNDFLGEFEAKASRLKNKWAGLSEDDLCLECWVVDENWNYEYTFDFSDPKDILGLLNEIITICEQALDLKLYDTCYDLIMVLMDNPIYAVGCEEAGYYEDLSYDFFYEQDRIKRSISSLWKALLPRLLENTKLAIDERMEDLSLSTWNITADRTFLEKAVKEAQLTEDNREKAACFLLDQLLEQAHIHHPNYWFGESSDFEECLSWITDSAKREEYFWSGLQFFPDLSVWYLDAYCKQKTTNEKIKLIKKALEQLSQLENTEDEQALLLDRLSSINKDTIQSDEALYNQDLTKKAFLLQPTLSRYLTLVQSNPDPNYADLLKNSHNDPKSWRLFSLLDGDIVSFMKTSALEYPYDDVRMLLSLLVRKIRNDDFQGCNIEELQLPIGELTKDTSDFLFSRAWKKAKFTAQKESEIVEFAYTKAINYCTSVTSGQNRDCYYDAARLASLCINVFAKNGYGTKSTALYKEIEPMYRRYPKFKKACQSLGIWYY